MKKACTYTCGSLFAYIFGCGTVSFLDQLPDFMATPPEFYNVPKDVAFWNFVRSQYIIGPLIPIGRVLMRINGASTFMIEPREFPYLSFKYNEKQ